LIDIGFGSVRVSISPIDYDRRIREDKIGGNVMKKEAI